MRKILVLSLIAALLIAALPAFAQNDYPSADIMSVVDPVCTPGESPTVMYSLNLPFNESEWFIVWGITNVTRGGSDSDETSTYGPIAVSGQTYTVPVQVPAGSTTGDTMRITLDVYQREQLVVSDSILYSCGDEPEETTPVPGCDVLINIPITSVVGQFKTLALGHWLPMVEAGTHPPTLFEPGWTAWVIGVDATGNYTKILWVCQFLWVETPTIGTNPDAVWNDTPLPVIVVE